MPFLFLFFFSFYFSFFIYLFFLLLSFFFCVFFLNVFHPYVSILNTIELNIENAFKSKNNENTCAYLHTLFAVFLTFVRQNTSLVRIEKGKDESRREITGLQGFRPVVTQTGLCSFRRWLEA